VKIELDVAACQGSGNCEALAPELFGFDEDQNKAVLETADPPAELEAAARAAEAGCPALAIKLRD
jgi:ferredoxin